MRDLLSKSLKPVILIRFLIPKTKVPFGKQLLNIHMYPAFNVATDSAAVSGASPDLLRACCISGHDAINELPIIRPNENSVMRVTREPLNHKYSPYAIRMIVRFLKIIYTGTDKYCSALLPV
jgi:hypothetical protein